MEQLRLRLTGRTPGMLHHNVRLVDPLDPYTKDLDRATKDAKKHKTEDSHRTLARVEFEAGLYWREDIGPYAPSTWLLKAMRDAAALTKKGKGIERGVDANEEFLPLVYDGPRDIQGMWDAKMYLRQAVGVGQSRVMRTRAHFQKWTLEVTLTYAPSIIDREDLILYAENAGVLMGLGDGRRLRYGRFDVKEI